MWGLVEICYANEEQYRQWKERQEKEPIAVITYAEERIPASQPLEILAAHMRRASPLALDFLINIFRPPEGERDFLMLVREYLPDAEQKIMGMRGVENRIVIFSEAFSSRYFPLYELCVDDYTDFTNRCPAESFAQGMYEYDEIAGSDDVASIVIASILENSWGTDRASFLEAASQYLPESLLKTIPDDGFPISELQELLTKTKFEPIVFWIKAILLETGNFFLDAGSIEDTGVDFRVTWDRPTIEELTRQWQRFEAWQGQWHKFKQWFINNLEENAYSLIKILKERSKADGGEALRGKEAYAIHDAHQGKLFDLEPDGA